MKTTTARQLLDLVFDGHHISLRYEDGIALFEFYAVAAACQISKPKDFAKKHLEKHHLRSIFVDSRSANGVVQKRAALYLTQSGVLAMVLGCRKPAARRFREYFLDEVLPQVLTYGTFIPGASPAERLQALNRRVRQERLACIQSSEATLAESGLITLKAFREEHRIAGRDVLSIARRLTALAKESGVTPTKLTLKGHTNPANAWPRHLIAAATNTTIPRLPL